MAAFTKTYADVSWSTGQYITQAKMRQEADNDAYLRDQFEGLWSFFAHGENSSEYTTSSSATHRTCCYIGGTIVWSGFVAPSQTGINIDISNEVTYPRGATMIGVGICDNGVTTIYGGGFARRCILTQEHKKLSVWTRGSSSYDTEFNDYTYRIGDTEVVLHRETYSW